ncbi:Bardet-Biedl syndrome 1 protein, partial [Clydaea vesicula]
KCDVSLTNVFQTAFALSNSTGVKSDSDLFAAQDSELFIFKGLSLLQKISLRSDPSSVLQLFFRDLEKVKEPTSVVAAAVEDEIQIYLKNEIVKNIKLPKIRVFSSLETEYWKNFTHNLINKSDFSETVNSLYTNFYNNLNEVYKKNLVALSYVSINFLNLQNDIEKQTSFVKNLTINWDDEKNIQITCMNTLKRSSTDIDAEDCLVVGVEEKFIYVLIPPAFKIQKFQVFSPVALISCYGVFENDYKITFSCRDNCVYVFKNGQENMKKLVVLDFPCKSLLAYKDYVLFSTFQQQVICTNFEGLQQFQLSFECEVLVLERIELKETNFSGFILSLENKEVRIYNGQYLLHTLVNTEPIVNLKFGYFGREANALVTIDAKGILEVKTLKRNATFNTNKEEGQMGIPSGTQNIVKVRQHSSFYHESIEYEKRFCKVKILSEIYADYQENFEKMQIYNAQYYKRYLKNLNANLNENLKLSEVNKNEQSAIPENAEKNFHMKEKNKILSNSIKAIPNPPKEEASELIENNCIQLPEQLSLEINLQNCINIEQRVTRINNTYLIGLLITSKVSLRNGIHIVLKSKKNYKIFKSIITVRIFDNSI